MAKKVWRHTLTKQEQKLWDREDMKGWCKALEGCVEDEGRDGKCKKYMIYNIEGEVVAKGDVSVLPDPKTDDAPREPVAF
jgi:hypothetical protein